MIGKMALFGAVLFGVGVTGTVFAVSHTALAAADAVSYNETRTLSVISNLDFEVDSGDLSVRPYSGQNIHIHVYGDVTQAEAENLDFTAANVDDTAQVRLKHKTQFGSWNWLSLFHMRETGVHIDIDVPVKVYQHLVVETGAGSVQMDNIHVSQGKVETGAGRMVLNDVTGALNLNSGAGSITLRTPELTNDVTASAGAGQVNVVFTQTPTNLTYDVHTGVGRIEVDLPGAQSGPTEMNRVTGQLGHGGPTLTVNTGAGQAVVQTASTNEEG